MSDENQNELQPVTPPNPNETPERRSRPWYCPGNVVIAVLAVMVGASALVPPQRTSQGATRSSRHQKEARQAEIESAMSEFGLTGNKETPKPEAK